MEKICTNNINIMWNNLHIFAILYVGKPME